MLARLRLLIIKLNSLNVVKLCNNLSSTLGEVDIVINDICNLLCQSQGCCIHFIPRVCNMMAHSIGKWSLANDDKFAWLEETPPWLSAKIKDDFSFFS